MKILHILPAKTGITVDYIKAIKEKDNFSEHLFIVLMNRNGVIKNVPDLLQFPFLHYLEVNRSFAYVRKILVLQKIISKVDYVIWHTLSMCYGSSMFLLFFNSKICKKSVWITNGSDIRSWRLSHQKLKKLIENYVNKNIRKKIPVVGVVWPSDIDELETSKLGQKIIFYTPYPMPEEIVNILKVHKMGNRQGHVRASWKMDAETAKKEWPNIQIGINSQIHNNHRKLLNWLVQYNEVNKKIFLPMNYELCKYPLERGNPTYVRRIGLAAKKLFGNQVYIMNHQVKKEIYFNYLERLDVVILGNSISISPHNILYMLAYNIKICFLPNSRLYSYLKENGAEVYEISEQNVSIDELLEPPKGKVLPDKFDFLFDKNKVMVYWEKLFKYLEQK